MDGASVRDGAALRLSAGVISVTTEELKIISSVYTRRAVFSCPSRLS